MSKKYDVFDSFKVHIPGTLSYDDYTVLTLLYQPLIGMDGLSLYVTLYNLIDNKTKESSSYPIKKILDLLNIKVDILKHITDKLEGIGLLDNYFNKENSYLFKLNFPLSANSFILDGSLGVYLYSQIGEREYRDLINRFKINIDTSKYENITKSFDEVFESSDDIKFDIVMDFFDKKRNSHINIINNDFDYDFFITLLSSNFLSDKEHTNKLKDIITKLAFTYKLNEYQMKEVYIRCINDVGDFQIDSLPKEARKEFKIINKMESPLLSNKRSKDDIVYEENKLLYLVENTHPLDLLKTLSGMEPSTSETKIIDQLLINTSYSPALINVLLLYVLQVNDKKMPTLPYFEKVANEWGRHGITTALEALDYIKKREITKKKPTKSRSKTNKANTPDWFEEYENSLKNQKDKENDDYDDVDLEKLSKSLKKI